MWTVAQCRLIGQCVAPFDDAGTWIRDVFYVLFYFLPLEHLPVYVLTLNFVSGIDTLDYNIITNGYTVKVNCVDSLFQSLIEPLGGE